MLHDAGRRSLSVAGVDQSLGRLFLERLPCETALMGDVAALRGLANSDQAFQLGWFLGHRRRYCFYIFSSLVSCITNAGDLS